MKLGLLKLGLLVGLCGGCSGEDGRSPEPAREAAFASAWAEFLPPEQIEAAFPLLGRHQVAVNLAWPVAQLSDPALTTLVKRASAAGVEIRPWLLLSEADGYWPGSTNAPVFASAARSLMDVWEKNGLAPTTFVVDMEMSKDRVDQLDALWRKDDVLGVVELMKSGVDPARYASATEQYATLVEEAQSRGWRVHLTTLPQVLDDYADGDDGLRQALGIPVEGIGWDVVTFQAYRTLFGDMLGGDTPPTAYFVHSYGKDARKLFGDKAGLDVGMVGEGVTPASTYASGSELAADLAAAAAAGIPRALLNVYNLDGVLARTPVEQWLGEPTELGAPDQDAATVSIRKNATILDGLL